MQVRCNKGSIEKDGRCVNESSSMEEKPIIEIVQVESVIHEGNPLTVVDLPGGEVLTQFEPIVDGEPSGMVHSFGVHLSGGAIAEFGETDPLKVDELFQANYVRNPEVEVLTTPFDLLDSFESSVEIHSAADYTFGLAYENLGLIAEGIIEDPNTPISSNPFYEMYLTMMGKDGLELDFSEVVDKSIDDDTYIESAANRGSLPYTGLLPDEVISLNEEIIQIYEESLKLGLSDDELKILTHAVLNTISQSYYLKNLGIEVPYDESN